MSKNKITGYLIPGIFLTLLALRNLGNFNLIYDGIALCAGVTSLILAAIAYTKNIDEEKKE